MGTLRFLRLPEVKNLTGLSRTEIYRKMDDGGFPRVIPLGKRSVAWRSDQIEAWMDQRISQAEQAITAPEAQRVARQEQSIFRRSARPP